MKIEDLLTLEEVRKDLNISRQKMTKVARLEDFPLLIIGKNKFVPIAAYEYWLKKNIGKKIIL
ncbi:MAG: hypothetical protein K6E27_03835 [Eubacterium sp.]|nr:hypothetical protein [Eubacterium sp.]